MKLTANQAIDMFADFYFFATDYTAVLSASQSRISLLDPNGNRQDYSGVFSYTYYGDLDWDYSVLRGFAQYSGLSVAWRSTGLDVPGNVYYDFAQADDGRGLIEYALQGDDVIAGSQFDDILGGGAGNDRINGRGGADFILGGYGKDVLTGGSGPDAFYFSSSDYTGVTPDLSSLVKDLKPLQGDRIVLDLRDDFGASLTTEYVQSFSGVAGQYTSQKVSGGFLLSLDSTGDGLADAFLAVRGLKVFDPACVTDYALWQAA